MGMNMEGVEIERRVSWEECGRGVGIERRVSWEEYGSGLGYRGGESSARNVEGVWRLRGGEIGGRMVECEDIGDVCYARLVGIECGD